MSLSSKTELARALFRTPSPDSVTRISGTATADSSDGTVTVQLEDGDVIEVGTIGSVSSGDTVTIHVQRGEAQVIASEGWGDAMQAAVDEATAIAEATGQHFWHDTNGAHVTEVTAEQWAQSQTGSNALWNSQGMLLRDALTYLAAFAPGSVAFYDGQGNATSNVTAKFGTTGVQVGKVGESHIEMDYHSMRLINKEGNEYLHVSDLRDQSGESSIVDTWRGDGTKTQFTLSYTATDTSYTVSVSDSSGGTATKTTAAVNFSTPPSDGSTITATYTTTLQLSAFTFGSRGAGTIGSGSSSFGTLNIASGHLSHVEGAASQASGFASHAEGSVGRAEGDYSHVEGFYSIANGEGSHAEGHYSKANGEDSHAQNRNTVADGDYQTAIGKNNVADTTSALIIGNGTAGNARSNALTVDWSGNVEAAGGLTLGGKAVSAWVVETGTDGGWAYEKRSDGTYRAKWSGNLSLNAGTAWGGFYYHQQSAAINAPSFSTGFEVVGAVKNNAVLSWYVGRVVSTTALQGYWINGSSAAVAASTFGTVTYTIEGTY